MSTHGPSHFLLILILLGGFSAAAQITSTFDTDTEGWTMTDINDSNPLTVVHNPSGGNPGGYASSTITTTQDRYWKAPAKFHGNLAYGSYGMNLKFDLQFSGAAVAHGATYGDLILESGGSRIVLNLVPFPGNTWTSYSIKLDATTAWRWNSIGGLIATKAQIVQVLTNVTDIRILGQYANTQPVIASIDNVIIEVKPVIAPPVATTFTPESGNIGTTVTINGSGFGTVIADNQVFFGTMPASIVAASATQLTVTVPSGARFGKIKIVNIATGRITQTAKSFTPTFTGGGRIIPASMSDKFDINLSAAAGNDVRGLNVGDVDGDGWVDIIVTENVTNRVLILRNKKITGTLTPSSFEFVDTLNTGNLGATVTDLDGDGKLDVTSIYSDGFYSWFSVHRNLSTPGTVSFEAAELFSSVNYSNSTLHAVDIDGDGREDLISSHGNGSVAPDFYAAQNISTPGNVEFAAPKTYFGGSTLDAVNTVSSGDLDGDGKPEIIVGHGFGNVFSILPNTSTPGIISFGTPIQFSVGVSFINVVDLNGDGKNDLVWKAGNPNDVRIRINTNSGGALAASDFATEVTIDSDLNNYGSLSIGDINGDGKPDILTTDDGDLGIFENVYAGGPFNANAFVEGYVYYGPGTSYPTGPVVADFNGDDKPDVIVGTTNTSPPRLSIYQNVNTRAPVISLNTISPLKGPAGTIVTITGNYFSSITTENIVYFGATRAVVSAATKNTLTVTVPDGATYDFVSVTRDGLTARYHLPFDPTFSPGSNFDATSFAPPVSFTLTTADYDISVGDMDNDGKPDIMTEAASQMGYAFRNTHSGSTITTSSLVADDTTSTSATNLKLVDLNGDGKLDITSQSGVYENISSAGNINFANLVTIGNTTNSSWEDFNKDGKTDLVGVSGTLLQIYENWTRPGPFVNTPIASFSAYVGITKPAANGGSAVADFDRDGFPDIAVTNPGTDNITIYRNSGGYRIATAMFTGTNFASGDNPGRIYIGDFDVDGKTDLAVYYSTTTTSQFITVFHNQSTPGAIAFNRVDFNLGGFATLLTVSDIDGDGKPELIATGEAADRFSIFKNTSTPGVLNASSFAAPVHYAVNNPRGIAAGDINLDGKPDLIINSAPNAMLIFQNTLASAPVITVNTHPVTTYACTDSNGTMTVSASGTTNITYRWQRYNSGTGAYDDLSSGVAYSGVTTNSLTINTAAGSGAGDYRAKVSGDNALDVFSNPATLTVNAKPGAPTTAGANSCAPAALLLSASGGVNGDYRWYNVVSGGSAIPGQANSTFLTPTLSVSTTYYATIVETTAGLTCESNRTPVLAQINLLAKPVAVLQTSVVNPNPSNLQLCAGQTATLTAPAGFASYTWSTGETTQQITINATGNYSFTVTDINGCVSPVSDNVVATINPNPVATITLSNEMLNASTGDSYQWYLFDQPVAGGSGQTFDLNILEYGVYAVEVTDNGCTTRSADFIYLVTGQEKTNHEINVYPNPVKDKLIVELSQNFHFELYDLHGRMVVRSPGKFKTSTVDFSSVSKGIYLLVIRRDNRVYNIRINHE